jgi:hypothetical protein
MRFRTLGVLGLAVLLWLGFAATPRTADASVDINVFVGALSPYGTWFDYPGYGRVWRPAHVRHGWRPYTDGRWVWSDDYGWVWDEDEDWGWATYHYGRWFHDRGYGWVWMPGYEWAPAWVRWRSGPDYIGWVPLPPAWFSISLVPSYWSFVPRRQFFYPHLRYVAFVPNRRVFDGCRDEFRLRHDDGRWFNRGVDRRGIERVARVSAPVVNVRDAERPGPTRFVRGGGSGRDELHIYRPDVREARAERADNVDRFSSRNRDERVQQESGRRPQPTAIRTSASATRVVAARGAAHEPAVASRPAAAAGAAAAAAAAAFAEIQRAFEPRPQVVERSRPSPRQERISTQRDESRPQAARPSFERPRQQRSFERHDRPSPSVQMQQARQPRVQQPPGVQPQRVQQPQREAQAARGQRRDLRNAQPAQQAPPAAIQPSGSRGNAYGNPHR